MEKSDFKKVLIFSFLAFFIVALIVSLKCISPEEIVEKIGVRNGYILIFFVSLFGGFSAGGSFSFVSLLVLLAAGGLDLFLLSLISGSSLAIGDLLVFYTGTKGRELITGRWNQRILKLSEKIEKRSALKKLIPFASYLYIGFVPLPNDIIFLFLIAIKYPMKRMVPIIIFGDLSFALTVAFLSSL